MTHDLGVVASLVDRVVVMYAGRVVEKATDAPAVRASHPPLHPGPAGIAAGTGDVSTALPLHQIGGTPPDPARLDAGCPFRSRCPYAIDQCAKEEPRAARPRAR